MGIDLLRIYEMKMGMEYDYLSDDTYLIGEIFAFQ